MKRKIKVVDKVNNKVVEGEVVVRNEDHFQAQLKYRARTYRDKTKYTRKQKHRSRDNDYHYALFVQQQVSQPSKLMVSGQHAHRAPCRISSKVERNIANVDKSERYRHMAP